MKKKRYEFRSKDGKARGLVTARSKAEVARFADRPISELIIKPAVWVLEEIKGGQNEN